MIFIIPTNRTISLFFATLFLASPHISAHSTVSYFYTGEKFTSILENYNQDYPASFYSLNDRVSISLTFDTALKTGINRFNFDVRGLVQIGTRKPTQWSATAGLGVIEPNKYSSFQGYLTIGQNGVVSDYYLSIGDSFAYTAIDSIYTNAISIDKDTGDNAFYMDGIGNPSIQFTSSRVRNSLSGTWRVEGLTPAVPENNSFILALAGLIILIPFIAKSSRAA